MFLKRAKPIVFETSDDEQSFEVTVRSGTQPISALYGFDTTTIEECPACGWTKREAPQESFTWEELEQLAEEL